MYNGCILRYGIIIFHKNEPPLPEVKHPGSGFFALDNSNFIPTLFQLFGISELFKITLEPCNYFKSYVSRIRLSDYRCNSAEPCKIHF